MVPKGTGDTMDPDQFRIQLFRVRDLCRLLSLPPSTVYRMISTGQLKAVRVPISAANPKGVLRVPREEVDRLLAATKHVAKVEQL